MTSTDGHELLVSLAATRSLFEQLSKLITSVDIGVSSENWEVISGNSSSDVSSHYQRPNRWMPDTLYRFYQLDEEKSGNVTEDIVLFLGVLLDRQYGGNGFTEPWLTYGLYQFFPGFELPGYKAEWVETPLAEGDQAPDGKFYVWDNSSGDPDENGKLLHQEIAALPLVNIESEDSLQDMVITPLLAAARERIEHIKPSS